MDDCFICKLCGVCLDGCEGRVQCGCIWRVIKTDSQNILADFQTEFRKHTIATLCHLIIRKNHSVQFRMGCYERANQLLAAIFKISIDNIVFVVWDILLFQNVFVGSQTFHGINVCLWTADITDVFRIVIDNQMTDALHESFLIVKNHRWITGHIGVENHNRNSKKLCKESAACIKINTTADQPHHNIQDIQMSIIRKLEQRIILIFVL